MNRRIIKKLFRPLPALLMCSAGLWLTSCFDDDNAGDQYKEWKEQNEAYLTQAEAKTDEAGRPYYQKIVPTWAPETYVLIHWHNDRSLTAGNLSPMDNSTTQITYELFNVDGELLSNSFASTDSIYTSKPSNNIIGVWSALTHMNVGDSVTLVIPSQAGYGEVSYGTIPPYSTLVYNIKLKGIPAYEVP